MISLTLLIWMILINVSLKPGLYISGLEGDGREAAQEIDNFDKVQLLRAAL